jgi:hypothetical protein
MEIGRGTLGNRRLWGGVMVVWDKGFNNLVHNYFLYKKMINQKQQITNFSPEPGRARSKTSGLGLSG